jgi:iron complex outermembrane receptor protein
MLTRLLASALCSLLCLSSYAQKFSVHGQILNGNNLPLENASIELKGASSEFTTISDNEGNYRFNNIDAGNYTLTVAHIGYKTQNRKFNLAESRKESFQLNIISYQKDEVIVISTRNNQKTGLNYGVVKNSDFEKENNGKDMPYLLNTQPSVVLTSDAGNGIGYTGIRIRGTDPSRINVTINGIPINDAESQNLYWVDMPDLASSVEDIQIQRGVGTSSNGTSTFGGSINIKTNTISAEPYGSSTFSYGSFNTIKNNIAAGSGLLNNHWFIDTRLSRIKSDGYVDRASSNLKSYYVSGGFTSDKTLVKGIVFSGKEITYQSWNGVPESRINNDVEAMSEFIDRNGLDEDDAKNLTESGRTYNYYLYANQVDDYLQDNYQLHLSQKITPYFTFNNAWHYTKGSGFYEEFKKQQYLSDYGIADVVAGNDTIKAADLIRRKWLDNDFYGTTFSFNYEKNRLQLIAGGAWNKYDGDHFGRVTWLQYASNVPADYEYYNDNAVKTDFNSYIKSVYDVTAKLFVFADLQLRNVNYKFIGYDRDGNTLPSEESLNFYNPKAGVTFKRNENETAYVTFAVANREPSRDDYVDSSPLSRPQHETLYDFEAGYQLKGKKLFAGINFYWMHYYNQLVLTGAVNDVGNYTRTNIKESFRRGVELMAAYNPIKKFEMKGNITLSENKMENFSEYLYNYDTYAEDKITYQNSDIAFSPAVTGSLMLTFSPVKDFKIGTVSKYVGEQFLDNTSNSKRKLDMYFVNDLSFNYSIRTKWVKQIDVCLFVYNLFDVVYESNGYTYGYISGQERIDENFYYPQAGTHFMGMVKVSF